MLSEKVSSKTLQELFKKAKSIKTLIKVYFKLHLDEPKTDYAIARATNPIWINKNEVERFFEVLVAELQKRRIYYDKKKHTLSKSSLTRKYVEGLTDGYKEVLELLIEG